MKFEFHNLGHGFLSEFSYTKQRTSTKTTQETTQKTVSRLLKLINENPKLNRKEIAQKLGNISENGVKYHIAKLIKEKVIIRRGSSKSGYWEILKK